MNLLTVDALQAGYAEPVVGPVSLVLSSGESVGIAGPNGVGKSTFLAALTGSARIFSGTIQKRPGLTLSLQQQRIPDIEGIPFRASELLDLTGASREGLPLQRQACLGERLDRLSGGQLQFLTLWACLDAPADLVLLDEPTNNLDPDSIVFLENALRHKTANGTSLLVVSHDARFVNAVCRRTLELHPRTRASRRS